MKNRIYTLAFLLFNSIIAFGQAPNWEWAKRAGGNDYDEGISITVDSSGNSYITGGFSSSTISFGSGISLTNTSGYDIFIAKYNAVGNAVWAKGIGGTDFEIGNSITVDESGNLYITGYFASSSVTFGSITLTNAGGTNHDDIFVARYDTAGNVLWAKRAGGNDVDEGVSITANSNGNIFLTGFFRSQSISFGSNALVNAGSVGTDDLFIVKYDTAGNVLWAKRAGGNLSDGSNSISTDVNGDSFITGTFGSSAITFGSTTLTNAGNTDIFIAKYDSSGNVIWAKSAGGPSFEVTHSIMTNAIGSSWVTGSFSSATLTLGSSVLTNAGISDMFVAKYDSSGNVLWANGTGGIRGESGISVALDANGNSYISGNFYSPTLMFGANTLTNADATGNTTDIFISKNNSLGNTTWVCSVGGTDQDVCSGMTVSTNGYLYITGYYISPVLTFGSTSFSTVGGYDIFIAKLGIVNGIAEENDFSNHLNIFPNPFTDKINITVKSYETAEIKFYDVTTRKIFNQSFTNSTSINTEQLAKGIYLYEVRNKNGVIKKGKVVKD